MSTLNVEHLKHENSSSNNVTLDSDGSVAFDTNTLYVDAVTNNVAIGRTDTSFGKLTVSGGYAYINEDGSNTKQLYLRSDQGGLGPSIQVATNHDLSIYTGNQQRMVVDAAGRVTMPYQPAFHAYPGSTVSVSSGNNKFTFNSTRFNIGGHYSTSTGRFTAPITGVYLFTFQAYYYPGTTSDSYQGINLFLNGGVVYVGYARGGYGDTTWGNSIHLRMNANDYLEFYTYPQSANNLNTNGSYLTGHLVG